MRVALGIEYDGGSYHGWQTQPGGGTVEDTLAAAVGQIAGHAVKLTAAGRTDAGVHAAHQVAHFDSHAGRPDSAWVRGVNRYLPPDVAVLWAKPMPDAFHARFSATGRCYIYSLLCHPVRPALCRRVGWSHATMDFEAVRRAARSLTGRHDFSAFRAAECQAKTPVRELRRLEVSADGPLLRFELCADAFLQHMVRNLIGTLVYVGQGRHPPEWAAEVLQSRDRRLAAPTLSAAGLCLVSVSYPPEFGLPGAGRAGPAAGSRPQAAMNCLW